MEARVYQLNKGMEDVPKYPVGCLRVARDGIVNELKKDKQSSITASKNVSLFSLESYAELKAKGFRIRRDTSNSKFFHRIGDVPMPGDLGENITTAELNYAGVKIGNVYQIGEEVRLQITGPMMPYKGVYNVFGPHIGNELFDARVANGDRTSLLWGKSGFYGRVLREGSIKKNDVIINL